jgi:hypothetical protein
MNESMNPAEGWFSKITKDDKGARLSLCLNFGKTTAEIVVIKQIEKTDEIAIGELIKKSIFVDGLAEFLNSGGTIREAVGMLNIVELDMFDQRDVKPARFEHWSYLDTHLNRNGNRVHDFVRNDKQRYARWVRNEYIDVNLTAKDLQEDDYYE